MAFRSGLEEKVADLLCNLGVKYEYEIEKVPYTIPHLYTPDFFLPSGVVLECKGYWDAEDRRKIKAVLRQIKHSLVFLCEYPNQMAHITSLNL